MNIEEVKGSYGRCALKPEFFDRFYDIFLNSHPSFKVLFKDTDFNKQKSLLKSTINYLLMFAGKSQFATRELDRVAVIHDEKHINIKPEYYKFWIDSLIGTLKEFDSKFSPELEKQWREVVAPGIELFISRHKVSE